MTPSPLPRRIVRLALQTGLWAGFIVCVLLLLALNGALVWVATGPRSLDRAIPYIEEALSSGEQGYRLQVGQGVLLWDGWRHPIDIRLKDLNIYTAEGQRFASFPDVSLGIDLISLLIGKVEPTSLRIRSPVVSLFQSADGSIAFGQQTAEAPPPEEGRGQALSAMLIGFFEASEATPLRKLRRIQVTDANVSLGNTERGVFLTAEQVNVTLRRGKRRAALDVRAMVGQAAFGRPDAYLAANLAMRPGTREFEGRLEAQGLWPASLAPLLKQGGELAALRFPVSGGVDVSLDRDGMPVAARYAIQGGEGSVQSARLEKELPLRSLQAEGSVQGMETLTVERLAVDFGPYAVQGEARITRGAEGLGAAARIGGVNVPLADVRLFWPPDLAPVSREWVITNITQGKATRATLEINAAPGAFDLPQLPEGALNAAVEFEGAEVRYLEKHAPARALSGTLYVGAKSLEAKVRKGETLSGTQLQNGRVAIDDLNLDNPRIEVSFDAEAPAADIISFLSLPPAQHAEKLKLDKATATGTVKGRTELGFYYFTPPGPDGKPRDDLGVDYKVEGEAHGVSQPGFMGRFDIADASGKMAVDNQGLRFTGSGTVNGAAARAADITYRFTPREGIDTVIDVKARAPVASLRRFGYPELPFLSGTLDAELKWEQGPQAERAQGAVNLKDAKVEWREMHWEKPAGEPARAEFSFVKENGAARFPQFSFSSETMQTKGEIALNAALEGVQKAEMPEFRLRDNDAALLYEAIPGGYRLGARGKRMDVSGWLDGGGDTFSFKKFPALDLTAELEELALAEGRELQSVKASAHCSPEYCREVNVSGAAKGGAFSFRLGAEGGQARALTVRADDAGSFLHALNLYDNMRGGRLSLSGKYDDALPARPLTGALVIDEHRIENAPVLAKLLSLASLGGLFDSLSGKGITFSRLNAPFTLEEDVITLKDAKTHGSAMGLTADGTIAFPGKTLDLKGTIVPSYSLNTVLGSIPLIGDVLGGSEGVFAARYTMRGPAAAPELSVNPLSILTPGFLRGVFDMGDEPPPVTQEKN